MHKKVLVCLPLNDAHRAALEASVPEFEFRFNALDDVHAEDVRWADVVLGNAPVSMISQNKHIEWFQSNSAGPDAYLKPGVLPENCMVTNATGAYGLAISEWMLAMWLGIQKDMFLYRDRQNQRQWAPIDRPVRGITGARVLCVGMGDIGSTSPAAPICWALRRWASAARSTPTRPARTTACVWWPRASWTRSCPRPTSSP